MKKVLLGILVIIPVIILMVVTLVSGIASVVAHIGVESVEIKVDSEYGDADSLTLEFSNVAKKVINLYDFVDVEVLPTRATNKVVEWSISNVQILDQEYETEYNYYLDHQDSEDVTEVKKAAILVDENGAEAEFNTTGDILISTYCTFTLKAMAENQQDQIEVSIIGYDIENLVLSTKKETISVGESFILETNYTPLDSIVTKVEWASDNEEIAIVNGNGIVKALKPGNATITCKAYRYTNQEEYVQDSYAIIVNKSSSLYGNTFYYNQNTLILSEYGIEGAEVVSGGTISGDELEITADVVPLTTLNGNLTIIKCEENDIKINEKEVLDKSSDYVIAVSDEIIELTASYLLSTKETNNLDVTWSSSNENIATIDNEGKLTTKSTGIVVITASLDGKTATIELNVQNKIASMQLITNETYYKVGIARETVFASLKYTNVAINNNTEANSILLKVKGEPSDATVEEINNFYSAYNFEVEEGSEYAHFDSEKPNCLVFDDELEGKGKQTLVIKVSAKYPRYSAFESYTTARLSVKAIYGIEISNYAELSQAVLDQKEYAYQDGNLIITTGDEYVCSVLDEEAKVSSKNTMAICMANSIEFPEGILLSENTKIIYGDFYGNNNMLSTKSSIVDEDGATLVSLSWSNITLSNIILRVNEVNEEGMVTSDEASEFKGRCFDVRSKENSDKYRVRNVNIEYSIIENSHKAGYVVSSDATFKGCIIRNVSNNGIYASNRVRIVDDKTYILPTNLIIENMIFSNCLGTAFDLDTYCYEIDYRDNESYVFGKNKEESDKYIKENLIPKGLNGSFVQKGFLDIYNWQSTEDVTLVKTGNQTTDEILKIASTTILGTDKKLENYRYRYKGVDYFHLGFMVESMDQDHLDKPLTLNETIWMDIEMEDTRFNKFKLGDVDNELASILASFGLTIYAYENNADLRPSSTYVINDKLIDKLHG